MLYNNSFIILHLAFLSMLFLLAVSFLNYKKDLKNIVNLSFMLMIFCEVIWCFGQLLEVYSRYFTGKIHMEFVYLYFSGMIMLPYFILMFCYTFINPDRKFNIKWLVIMIPQIISLIVLFLNDRYHLFIVEYAPINTDMKLGAYFKFHNVIISYPYIMFGLYYIMVNGYYRKETSRLNSRQIPFILSGILIPFIVNALSTFKLIVAPTYISAVASISTGILWYMIIYKYNFITSDQVAIRYIYDNLNDCILVVNENDIIIDYNEKFLDLFSNDIVKKSMDLNVLKRELIDPVALNNIKKLDFYLNNDPHRKDRGDFFVIHNLTQYFEIECKIIDKCKILILKDRTKHHWQIIETIIRIVDAKNKYTSGHSARVAKYSVKIAAQLNMEKGEIMTLWSAGLAHDIGKIGLSDEILNSDKRYAPDSDEFREIKRHVEVGAALIGSLEEFRYLQPIVLYHHERIDGKGYLGIKGNEIPFMSRILAVADTYDAMSSGRKYQDKPIRECYEVLNILAQSDIGTQLDEKCFKAFVQVMINEGYIKKYKDQNGKFIGTGKLHDFVERNVNNKLIIREDYEEELSTDVDDLYKSLIY